MTEAKVTNDVVVVKKDWKYHVKSGFITFLMFFLPFLIWELKQLKESGVFELEVITMASLLGFLGVLVRAIIKAVFEAIVPVVIELATKLLDTLKKKK